MLVLLDAWLVVLVSRLLLTKLFVQSVEKGGHHQHPMHADHLRTGVGLPSAVFRHVLPVPNHTGNVPYHCSASDACSCWVDDLDLVTFTPDGLHGLDHVESTTTRSTAAMGQGFRSMNFADGELQNLLQTHVAAACIFDLVRA
jgi:hypothetical protein